MASKLAPEVRANEADRHSQLSKVGCTFAQPYYSYIDVHSSAESAKKLHQPHPFKDGFKRVEDGESCLRIFQLIARVRL